MTVKLICRKEADFMRQEPVFIFHNPNSEKDTYNALVKVFTKVGCRKLKDIITEHERNCKETENSNGTIKELQ